jgi:branched-chain amino acid transport system permease protein
MERFIGLTFSGISTGMIYAAVALAIVLIWRATRVVNFAQGALGMITTYIAFSVLSAGAPYPVAFLVALVSGFVIGGVAERFLVRPVETGPPLNAIIVTLGLLIFVEAIAGMIWSGRFRPFPSPLGIRNFQLGGISTLSPSDLFTIAAVAVIAIGLFVLFQYTDVGLRMRAAAFEGEVARMLGVKVGQMLTLGWALASVAGSLAGVLVAPAVFLHPNNMDGVFITGFTAAVIGGLDSPVGALVGGLGLGIVLSWVSGYLGGDLVTLAALVALIAVLMVRPNGIFTRAEVRRV